MSFSILFCITLYISTILSEYPVCKNSGRVCNVNGGECCSQHEWCGSGDAWCNENSLYPNKNGPAPGPAPGPGPAPAPKISGERVICPNEGRICDPNQCCSKFHYCGTSDLHCNSESLYLQANKTPTKSPVMAPTKNPLKKGDPTQAPTTTPKREPNQIITGCVCKIEGDPHIFQWNCGRINYQGPHRYDPPGSFEYVTICDGFDRQDMPFDVIGTHVRWGPHFTALDYQTVKLYDDDGKIYYVRVGGAFGVQYSDDNKNWKNVEQDKDMVIGTKFKINWYYDGNGLVNFNMDIDGDDCGTALHIDTYRVLNTVWQDAANIKLADCYKGYTCGLCGSFNYRWPLMETKKGGVTSLNGGYFGRTAENYDGFGYLVKGSRLNSRRLADEKYHISNMTSACFNMEDDLLLKCKRELPNYEQCCSLRHGYCERTSLDYCKIDSCACIAYNMDKQKLTTKDEIIKANIDTKCVENTMAQLMNFTCKLPADDFVVPMDSLPKNFQNGFCDSLVETSLAEAYKTKDFEKTTKIDIGTLFIGIGIGLLVSVIVGVIMWFTCCKKKDNGYASIDVSDSDTSDMEN